LNTCSIGDHADFALGLQNQACSPRFAVLNLKRIDLEPLKQQLNREGFLVGYVQLNAPEVICLGHDA
jgi:hypothetical protein